MAETIGVERRAVAPELALLAAARREGWSRERLRAELLVVATTLTVEEIARLVEAAVPKEAGDAMDLATEETAARP